MVDPVKVKPLSKLQIATHLAEKLELSKKQATEFLDELAALAYAQTSTTGEFTVPGIGKLIKQERAAREGRNPSTGEAMRIEAKTVVKFRIAKAAKDAVLPPADKT
jgi:DNA-binding protein HU-beta